MPSLRALARDLGVSPATVSRALAGRPHVQDAMRSRILAAAVAAGIASPSAGAAAGRRLLALVASSWGRGRHGAALADLLAGAAQGARQAGAVLHSLTVDGQPVSLAAVPDAQRLRPSALLLCHWHDDASAAALSRELPSVVVGQPPPDPSAVRHATFDAANGVLRLLDHLLGLGHRRIAFLGDAATGWRGCERLGAAHAAALQRGIGLDVLRVEAGGGWDAVRTALQAGTTGWICDAQVTGEALLARCTDWSVRVPQDASVCGFFFTPPAADAPCLTGMRGDWRAVGRIAARWALTRPDRLDPGTRLLVQSQVEPGGTTGPFRPARGRRRAGLPR
jgi:DNA-binding LacI/PurR family transcriptional regulator